MADITPRDTPGPDGMRASDADREQVAEVLREAVAEGRISMDELNDRLDAVYAARTYTELAPIARDLPGPGTAPALRPGSGLAPPGAPASGAGVAIMGGFVRKGAWAVRRRFTAFTFWGGGQIDLRQAQFTEPVLHIRAVAIMGGVEIIVPEDVDVSTGGLGLMGGFSHVSHTGSRPAARQVKITGVAIMGGVAVKRLPPDPAPFPLEPSPPQLGS